jgi:hypothetical protein
LESPPAKEFPTSIVLPLDLKATIKRACKRQGCSMTFKITQVLRKWEQDFLAKEKEMGRGNVE